MNLHQLFLIFKARYKIALITMLVITLATLAISLLMLNRYTASTAVVVDMRMGQPDPVPEPATLVLVGTGFIFAARRWRRR